MQIDNTAGAPDSPANRNKPSRSDSQRWLEELEREFLQANDSAAQAGAGRDADRAPDARAGDPGTLDGASARSSAQDGKAASGHAGRAREDALASTRRVPANGASRPASDAAPQDSAAATAAPTGTANGSGTVDAFVAPNALRVDATMPEPIASPPVVATERVLGLLAQAQPPAASGRPLAAPPRYARQLMSLTDGEHASATIRDAGLAAADSENVARSVSLQLQAAGFGVQRIFINGQRFDSTPSGIAPRPARLQPLLQDDDA